MTAATTTPAPGLRTELRWLLADVWTLTLRGLRFWRREPTQIIAGLGFSIMLVVLFAFLFTSTNNVKTLPVIMRQFALGEPAVWGVSAAGALLTTLPVALVFLLFQRMLMSGLAAGAVKG